jgi:hypothetical protein
MSAKVRRREFISLLGGSRPGAWARTTLAESSLSGKARRNTGIGGRKPGSTSGSRHGVGDLFTALRRQGLTADELVLQLTTFLRSLDLFLKLIVLAPRTFTANQDRHGGKQGTDNPEHSRIHSSTCPALTSLLRSFPAQRLTISLTSRSFLERKPLRQQRSPPSEPLPLAYKRWLAQLSL